jgi:hypothetical protein
MTSPPRIRRPRVIRLVFLNPGDPEPPRRRNPHGWRVANEARRRQARWKATYMLYCRLAGYSAEAIALMFGTTRTAVYQQLYRLRSGFYDRPPARKASPPSLKIEYVFAVPPAPEPVG